MLTIISGVPGSGKSLYALSLVTEGKPPHIKPNVRFINFDVHDKSLLITIEDLRKQPPGTVIVVDEAQKYFGPKPPTVPLPAYQDLAEHRHDGIDVILITQHPSQLDARYRRLCNDHYHVVRVFGADSARIHHWSEIHEDVSSRAESDASIWFYDKSLYSLYHSADLHTGKKRIPKRLIFGLATLFLVPGLFYLAWHVFMSSKTFEKPQPSASSSGVVARAESSPPSRSERDRPLTAPEYLLAHQAVIQSLPQTAPIYQKLAQPKTFPVIAGCLQIAGHCTCYTQQATPFAVDDATCHAYLRHLPFMDAAPPALHLQPAFIESSPKPSTSAPLPTQLPVPLDVVRSSPPRQLPSLPPSAPASAPHPIVPRGSQWRFQG